MAPKVLQHNFFMPQGDVDKKPKMYLCDPIWVSLLSRNDVRIKN